MWTRPYPHEAEVPGHSSQAANGPRFVGLLSRNSVVTPISTPSESIRHRRGGMASDSALSRVSTRSQASGYGR